MPLLFYNRAEGKGEFYNVQDAQGNLQLLGSHTGWRTSWTHIVDCSNPSLLFYDSNSGAAEFYALDLNANMQLLSSTTFSKGWTHIVLVGTSEGPGFGQLLFYNANSGVAQFYTTDAQGGIHQHGNTTFSKGWTHIVPFTFAQGRQGLMFYNTSNGVTQVYLLDGMQQLFNSTLSTGWTHIVVTGRGGDTSGTILFYNSNNGAARYGVVNGNGGFDQLASASYAHGWTHIPAGTISSGLDGNVIFAYLFYNASTGAAQFYQLNAPGDITQLSNTTFSRGWSEIVWQAFP